MLNVAINDPKLEAFFHHSEKEVLECLELHFSMSKIEINDINEAKKRIEHARQGHFVDQDTYEKEMNGFFEKS